jgi:RHS repeat-associated protein
MMSVSDYAMASAPGTVVLGNGVDRVDDYDQRRRLVSRTYVQGGNIVASFRYAYDSANREVARVDVHRAGRANLYSYDQERLGTANIGARPTVFGSLPTNGDFGVGDAHFTSVYAPITFDDRLQEVVTQVPVGESTPEIAELYQGYDAMGHATLLDGVARTRDSLGNVTSTPSEQGTLALDYDVRSRLRQATRPDGSTVTYDYRADDALLGRTVTCAVGAADCVDSNRVYVYDGLLLLQEHEQGATPSLRAQYFYADEGDVPFAADLWNATTQQLERYYYVVDRMGSVVGLMDASGQVVERIDYTVFGYPQITGQDTAAPAVSSVRSDGSGRLELVFSEPVDPAVSGTPVPVSNGQVGIEVNDLTSHITVRDGQGATVAVTDVTVVSDAAHRYGTVYSLTTTPLAAGISYTVDVSAGAVQDAWANLSSAQAVTVTYAAAAGTLQATGTVAGSTAPAVLARSAVGNSIGFQAHLHDWDVDLVLARARVYDARSGMFLQRDPEGYEDSVNLYAGMRWDPVNLRDPTGRATGDPRFYMSQALGQLIEFFTGGRADPARDKKPKLSGRGGVVGGAVEAACFRCGYLESDRTGLSSIGADHGAGMVPYLDSGMTLATGEDVQGREVGRGEAALRFGLEVLPLAVPATRRLRSGPNRRIASGDLSLAATDELPGAAVFTKEADEFGRNAQKAKPVDGYTDIALHGGDDFVSQVPNPRLDEKISSDQFARLLKRSPSYNGGPIRLIACDTGSCATGFAQQLSNALGVRVRAPSTYVWALPDGTLFVADPVRVLVRGPSGLGVRQLPVADLTKPGTWVDFDPE